jgi:glycosyltransferase involved in cell wall biosynthesis
MRIGLVVSGGVDRSGRERVIPALLWLIERLAARHDVHVFALHYESARSTYPLLGATVHDLGTGRVPPGLRRLVQRRRLDAVLGSLPRFDLLHAYWGIPAGWVATSVGRTHNLPVIVTADSGEFVSDEALGYGFRRRWFDRRLVQQTMARARQVTVCTRHMAGLARECGVDAHVISIGVPRSHIVSPVRAQGPPWRLLHTGHLNRVKDQPTLLRAVARVRATHDVHLDIVGGDTLGGQVQRLAHELGLTPDVTFHGVLAHDEVRALVCRAHVHVQSSRHEAAGVAVLEAAAGGVPTVGTAVGYVADWSPDAAVAVPVGDPVALAQALVDVLNDPARVQRLATAAHARVLAHTADETVDAFERLYRRH